MSHKIVDKLATVNLETSYQGLMAMLSDNMLEDSNGALRTIPITTVTQTNELVYATVSVILKILGYTIKKNINTYHPPIPTHGK